jgi:hypothetical protein
MSTVTFGAPVSQFITNAFTAALFLVLLSMSVFYSNIAAVMISVLYLLYDVGFIFRIVSVGFQLHIFRHFKRRLRSSGKYHKHHKSERYQGFFHNRRYCGLKKEGSSCNIENIFMQ